VINPVYKKYGLSKLPKRYEERLTVNFKWIIKLLDRRDDLIRRWVELFKAACDEGSSIPTDLAWIKFNDEYIATEDGWEKK